MYDDNTNFEKKSSSLTWWALLSEWVSKYKNICGLKNLGAMRNNCNRYEQV